MSMLSFERTWGKGDKTHTAEGAGIVPSPSEVIRGFVWLLGVKRRDEDC